MGKRLGDERGQLLLPSVFVVGMLLLVFVFLADVVRLSRGKIRSQFGLDVSAHLEMEQYADTLNRLAYVNGVFPDRIFKDLYGSSWGSYHANGLFPASDGPVSEDEGTWPIRFGAERAFANVPDPPQNFGYLHMMPEGGNPVGLDAATNMASNYITAYQWLGDVAVSVKSVFYRTTLSDHGLLRKSLLMNSAWSEAAGGIARGCAAQSCGDEVAAYFPRIKIRMHYAQRFKHCPVMVSVDGQNYVGEMTGPFDFSGLGLWQLATVPGEDLEMLRRGFEAKMHWQPPPNSFGVDFAETLRPFVHSRLAVDGGRVWPDTTPKFRSRLAP